MALGAVALVGCQRDELSEPGVLSGKEGVVKFAPNLVCIDSEFKSGVTKSEMQSSLPLASEDGSYSLPMSCSVSTFESGALTKGALINDPGTEGGPVKPLSDYADKIDNTFWVAAWNDAATPARIIPDQALSEGYTSTDGKYQKVMYRTKDVAGNDLTTPYWMTMQPMGALNEGVTAIGPADDEYIWKKTEEKTFYAYANLPSSGASVALLDANAGQTLSHTVSSSVSDHKDILMGYYAGDGSTGSPATQTGTASIHFYHPLTAIIFKVGNIEGVKSIDNISICGVYASGDATMDATTVGKAVAESKVEEAVEWSNCTGSTTVSQIITGNIPDTGTELGEAFLLIPQQFDAESSARIAITLTLDDGNSRTLYSPLASKEWLAGHVYRYSIGLAEGEVSLKTEGDFTPTSVSNVAVSNNGDISDNVRVLVIANWVDASGNVVKTIDWKQAGTITDMAPEDKWKKHTDGYYYYRSGVSPGSTTAPLFGSYTPPAAPSTGLSLEMRVIAQGVKFIEGASIAKSVWGDDIPVTGTLE